MVAIHIKYSLQNGFPVMSNVDNLESFRGRLLGKLCTSLFLKSTNVRFSQSHMDVDISLILLLEALRTLIILRLPILKLILIRQLDDISSSMRLVRLPMDSGNLVNLFVVSLRIFHVLLQ